MNINDILSKVDHTLLSPDATWEDIKQIIDDGIKYNTASVCIPPFFVKEGAEYANGKVKICTVIGFPTGYSLTDVKIAETKAAIADGADEIDMVINIGKLKAKDYDFVLTEINQIKAACGNKVLKVIIETCLLSEEEKIKMCEIVNNSSADFIKTSTGFSKGGATLGDIVLFKKHISEDKRIKAAGGIASLEDAKAFVNAGADRLGTSRIVKIVKEATL